MVAPEIPNAENPDCGVSHLLELVQKRVGETATAATASGDPSIDVECGGVEDVMARRNMQLRPIIQGQYIARFSDIVGEKRAAELYQEERSAYYEASIAEAMDSTYIDASSDTSRTWRNTDRD